MKDKNVYASVKAGGMDVHYKFSTVTMRDAGGKVVRRERLDHRDRQALRRKLSSWPKDAPMVLEASFGWGWLVDLMQELGLRPQLSNCYKVEQMRKARGLAKTNKKDADLFGAAGRKFLAELCRQSGTEEVGLPDGARAALGSLLELLAHIRGQLARIATELRGQLERSDLAKLLDMIPGIGLVLSHTLMAEIGRMERFADHRALASYGLLAPMADDTGEDDGRKPMGRRLGHRGNKTLQWALLEAAHGAVKRGGKWRQWFDAVTEGGTKDRNRGYIKVARELLKVVYVVWKKRVRYTDSPAARPGSPRQRMEAFLAKTRSGTGQSCRAMAAVR